MVLTGTCGSLQVLFEALDEPNGTGCTQEAKQHVEPAYSGPGLPSPTFILPGLENMRQCLCMSGVAHHQHKFAGKLLLDIHATTSRAPWLPECHRVWRSYSTRYDWPSQRWAQYDCSRCRFVMRNPFLNMWSRYLALRVDSLPSKVTV